MLIHDIYDRLTSGEEKIYKELFVLYYHRLVRVAAGILWDQAEAEDVVQMAMLNFYRAIQDGQLRRDTGPIYPYLRNTVKNEAANRLGHLKRWHKNLYLYLKSYMTPATPFDLTLATEDEKIILTEMGKLPRRQRQCCYLYFVEDESYSAIAENLGISIPDVRKHVMRGRNKLIASFERDFTEEE